MTDIDALIKSVYPDYGGRQSSVAAYVEPRLLTKDKDLLKELRRHLKGVVRPPKQRMNEAMIIFQDEAVKRIKRGKL